MRKPIVAIGFTAYAFLLAFLHQIGGVRTDEAKYLLDIPYPHPPIARGILHLTEWIPYQDFLWRIVFAFLSVFAVVLVWKMSAGLSQRMREAVCILWLASATFIIQTGTIMMSPLTALQALTFLFVFDWQQRNSRKHIPGSYYAVFALWWCASLFTAFQAALFFPLILAIFLQSRMPRMHALYYTFVPLGLLGLYTLTNPLALASILNVAGSGVSISIYQRLLDALTIWLVAGSIIGSIVGTIAIIKAKSWPLLASFILVAVYIALSPQDYYAVLFLPLFVAGLLLHCKQRKNLQPLFSSAVLTSTIAIVLITSPFATKNLARDTANTLLINDPSQTVMIVGSFGHEWQYYLPYSIVRYASLLDMPIIDIVVCLKECDDVLDSEFSDQYRMYYTL